MTLSWSTGNGEPYSTTASIGSDYHIVTATIRLGVHRKKTPPNKVKYDWSALSKNCDIQKQYTYEVWNRFYILELRFEIETKQYKHTKNPILACPQQRVVLKRMVFVIFSNC